MKSFRKYIGLFVLPLLMMMASCEEDLPKNVESNDYTVIKSIKLLNAGANGDQVLEGTIDEEKKKSFFLK